MMKLTNKQWVDVMDKAIKNRGFIPEYGDYNNEWAFSGFDYKDTEVLIYKTSEGFDFYVVKNDIIESYKTLKKGFEDLENLYLFK